MGSLTLKTQSQNLQDCWQENNKEDKAMAKIYYKRIIAELMTIDDVPSKWRAAVEAMLAED